MTDDRLVTAGRAEDEVQYEAGLRPRTLDEYIGQDRLRGNLLVAIRARSSGASSRPRVAVRPAGRARPRWPTDRQRAGGGDASDGGSGDAAGRRPGGGSATSSRATSCSSTKCTDARRSKRRSYPAMEDYQRDIMIGEGPGARYDQADGRAVHVIGATTRTGLLTSPLRARFGSCAARFLQRAGHPGNRAAVGAHLGVPIEREAAAEWRAVARHAARGQPAAAPVCATTPRSAPTDKHQGRRRPRPGDARGDDTASTRSIAACC